MERLKEIVALSQERIKVLSEINDMSDFFFGPPKYDPKSVKKTLTSQGRQVLMTLEKELADTPWEPDALEAAVRGVADRLAIKAKDAFQPLRVAITGSLVSPPLVESMKILGRETCLERIRQGIALCESKS